MKDNFAIIFDMDGVMIDNNTFHKKAWNVFVTQHNFSLSEDTLKQHVYGKTNKDILEFLFEKQLSEQEVHVYAEEKERIYREIYAPDINPTPGLITFLRELEQQSITKAIATSAPPSNVSFVLSSIHAAQFFDVIIDDTHVQNGKPDPEIYIKTAKKLNINPTYCVVFEDSLSGVAAAKAAGMKVVGITTTHSKDELTGTDLVINDFTTLTVSQVRDLIS